MNITIVLTTLYILFSLIYYLFCDFVRTKEDEITNTEFHEISKGNLKANETDAFISGTLTF